MHTCHRVNTISLLEFYKVTCNLIMWVQRKVEKRWLNYTSEIGLCLCFDLTYFLFYLVYNLVFMGHRFILCVFLTVFISLSLSICDLHHQFSDSPMKCWHQRATNKRATLGPNSHIVANSKNWTDRALRHRDNSSYSPTFRSSCVFMSQQVTALGESQLLTHTQSCGKNGNVSTSLWANTDQWL